MCQVAKQALEVAEKAGGNGEEAVARLARAVSRARKLEIWDTEVTKQQRRDEGEDPDAYDINHRFWEAFIDFDMLVRCERRLTELRGMREKEEEGERTRQSILQHCARLGTQMSDDDASAHARRSPRHGAPWYLVGHTLLLRAMPMRTVASDVRRTIRRVDR